MSSPDEPTDAPAADAPAADAPAADEALAEETLADETPADDPRQELLDALRAELGDAIVGSEIQRGDLWVRVRPDAWQRTAEVCRRSLGFDYFCFLSGLDWMPHTWPNPKVEGASADAATTSDDEEAPTEETVTSDDIQDDTATGGGDGWKTGNAGGDTRFQVFARLYSTTRHLGVTLKADLDEENPTVASWAEVYPGADWHERETWEMYGFTFEGHPNLIHLYLPGEFEGFPLRKDYGLIAREVKPWPGLVDVEPMPGESEADAAATADALTAGEEA